MEENIFGEKVLDLLQEQKMLRKDLAEQTGISVGTISRYINGKGYPDPVYCKKIADVLQVSVNDLMAMKNKNEEKSFGEVLQSFINNKNISKIAEQVGIKEKTLSRYIDGTSIPGYTIISRLAKVLQIKPNVLNKARNISKYRYAATKICMSEDTFGQILFKLLCEKHISQRELAKRIGISEVSVHRYISSNMIPSSHIVNKIASELNVEPEYFLKSQITFDIIKKAKILSIFGCRLSELLYENDMTESELSRRIGLSYDMVRRYIKGYHMPKPDTLKKIAVELNTTPEYLLGIKEANDFDVEYMEIYRLIVKNVSYMTAEQKQELTRIINKTDDKRENK